MNFELLPITISIWGLITRNSVNTMVRIHHVLIKLHDVGLDYQIILLHKIFLWEHRMSSLCMMFIPCYAELVQSAWCFGHIVLNEVTVHGCCCHVVLNNHPTWCFYYIAVNFDQIRSDGSLPILGHLSSCFHAIRWYLARNDFRFSCFRGHWRLKYMC
jgi:hypothetical protein